MNKSKDQRVPTANRKPQLGSSLFELVASLMIVIPLMMSFTVLYRHTVKLLHSQEAYDKNTKAEFLLRAHLKQLLYDFDSHRLPIPLRVHKRGRIETANNIELLPSKNPALRIAHNSTAITGFELDITRSMFVLRSTGNKLLVCPRYNLPYLSKHQQFIALDSEQAFEIQAVTLEQDNSSKCRLLLIQSNGGMLLATRNLLDIQLKVLVPIERIYTLYRSASSELRFLTHSGEAVTENQRISGHLRSLNLSVEELEDSGRLVLQIQSSFSNNEKRNWILSHALKRKTIQQFVLERP